MKFPGEIGLLMLVPILFRHYFVYKLEKQSREFRYSRLLGRIYLWAFPIFKKPRTQEQKRLIRAANISTGIFWAMFFLIIILAVVLYEVD
jgi:hypothetical protein